VPIVYSVERLRDGRSYLTRAVRARQHGQIVFMMMCSFQKEEPWQPTQQWRMPLVPPPNECQLEEERVAELLKADNVHPRIREIYHQAIQVRISVCAKGLW
jgi:acyl-CoA thioesterase II